MITHIKQNIPDSELENMANIFLFVCKTLIRHTVSFATMLLFFACIVFSMIFNIKLLLGLPVCFVLLYLMAALEETYHILMLVILGKRHTIQNLDVTKLKFGFVEMIGGVSVCYTGMFKKSDLFYISLAGPVMPLFYVCIIFALIFGLKIIFGFQLPFLNVCIGCSAICPLLSFVPVSKNGYLSDGARIFSFLKSGVMKRKEVYQALKYTFRVLLSATFKNRRKDG